MRDADIVVDGCTWFVFVNGGDSATKDRYMYVLPSALYTLRLYTVGFVHAYTHCHVICLHCLVRFVHVTSSYSFKRMLVLRSCVWGVLRRRITIMFRKIWI